MPGCYLTFNPGTCQVYLTRTPIQGSSQWYPGLPSQTGGTNYGVYAFNQQYPGYLTVPAHCIPAGAGGGIVGKFPPVPPPPPPPPEEADPPPAEVPGPITGDPPPEACGAGVPIEIPENPRDTSSSWWQDGKTGPGGTEGSGLFDQMAQPLVLGMTPLPTYASNKPVYTQEPYFQIRSGDKHAIADAYHEGTGPGMVVFHPPELVDFMLHGPTAQFPRSKWPTNISASSLMLHNAGRDDGSTGDAAVTYFAMGTPIKGSVKPALGHYLAMNLAEYELCLFTTGSTGADIDNGTFTLKEMCFNLGQQADAGLGLYTGAQAGALIWNTDNERVEFYNGSVWDALGGSGDVVGPASARDNAFTRYDATTGKLIQDSDLELRDLAGNAIIVKPFTTITGAGTTLFLQAGARTDAGSGADVKIEAEAAVTSGIGGWVRIDAGDGAGVATPGGGIILRAGSGTLGGNGGNVSTAGGNGSAVGNTKGGKSNIAGGSGMGTGQGGGVDIDGGFGGSGGGQGGDIWIRAGVGGAAAKDGLIYIGTVNTDEIFIGAAGTPVNFNGGVRSSDPSITGGIGYTVGAGGQVTQLTSKSTTVVLNAVCGNVTMHNANLVAGDTVIFQVSNSSVSGTDVAVVIHAGGGTFGAYVVQSVNTGGGALRFSVTNITGGDLAEAITLTFALIKAVGS